MKGEFEVRVIFRRLPLSHSSQAALQHVDRYDAVVCTSKNAQRFFEEELERRHKTSPRIIRVGPRADLLKLDLKGQRILFPRSALAPHDIIRKLRARGSVIRVVPLYTAEGARLSSAERAALLKGTVRQLYFKSPSGIHGLLRQFRGMSRDAILLIPARCIGETTAQVAREAGFKRVFIR